MARPAFCPTQAQRDQVIEWIAAKVPIEGMARRLGLAPKTFRKHFAAQLGIAPPVGEDLFVEPTGPDPRPKVEGYRPTSDVRQLVEILVGADISKHEIARKIGISVEMLEQHFADELDMGIAKCGGDVIVQLYRSATGGNVSAMKLYLMLSKQRSAEERDRDRPRPPVEVMNTGKKEVAQLQSNNAVAGTKFEGLIN